MEDCSVGSIVWVRRRNGSWWPGRILGPEELSASHIMSPRSGTPVKLLGREDASVDYYNLEKSKRVKAFRCGEFDACIERAEASQGIPIKKREKYARREDAILHALELEQKQLGMKQKKPGNISVGMSSKTTGAPKKELSDLSPEVYMRNDDPGLYSKFVSHKYQIVPHEEDNISKSLYTRKELGWEKDNPEAISRMEGLQDFGLQIAPSKRELFPSVTWETSGKPVENHVDVLSCVRLMRKDAVHTVGCRNSLSSKRKRPEGSLVEETLFRKHDRHRPLVHAKPPISPSFQLDYDAGVISREDETNHMGSICQAKRSRYIYLPANSNDSLDHSGYLSGEMTINDDLHHLASLAEEYTSSGLIEATESNSSERIFWEDEMEEEAKLLTDDILAPVPGSKDCDPPGFHIPDKFGYANNAEIPLSSCISQSSAEVGVYSWCSKGKRNARSIARKPFDETGGKIYATVSGKHYGSSKGTTKMGRTDSSSLYHKKGFNHAFDGGDTNSGGTHLTGYGTHISFNDSDSDPSDGPHSARRVYWGESDSFFEPMLVDVDLKVQTKYQGEHVPLVSLMSRLNGKAIIGHPVQIEILEDGGGLVDSRASTSTPIWRTARRSAAQRVARSRPAMSALESWDTELVKKSMPHARRSIPGKSHKKLASNLKIKTLSYTASDRKRRGRLIDPEMVVPLVACVPVKVVFSRILEAVRVRVSGPGLRGPS